MTVTGEGFADGALITISFHSKPVVVGKAVADGLGAFSATVAVPDSASAGTHRFEAAGRGRTGPISELIATVNIVGVAGADTSSTLQRMVLTAAAVVIPAATWLALVARTQWRRRRRRQAASRPAMG